ncbi:MAG: SMC-Scp complex subunit ScpB [Deltaproteobacteria bacterium]|nr:SMC-Scp complex subunit ScpB [Deltaproteobacteria bacterium]
MDKFEDEEVIGDEAAEAAAEAAGEAVPFDEEQLLELAKTEGLLDPSIDTEPPADPATPLDLEESDQANIMASIETILFMSDKPVSLPKLRATINPETPLSAYRVLMAKLRAEYGKDHRGIEIAEVSLGFQLRTKAHMAAVLRRMVKTQPLRLSTATMEVLAVTAYKQPVTKDEIDQIRGVDSGYVLRNLMEKRLVRIAGRSDLPGKPMVYGTTHEFLELFNMKDTQALPPLHEVESMVAASEVGFEEKTQAVMQEFGKMVASSDRVLFDDSKVDEELEALRNEIAAIPTSTSFIDEQKAKEKLDAKLAELALSGMTLDAEGDIVPIGSVVMTSAIAADSDVIVQVTAPVTEAAEHQPSSELEADAAAAQWERHAAMIADAVAQTQVEGEAVVVNAEALADAVLEAKIEHELAEDKQEPKREPEAEI